MSGRALVKPRRCRRDSLGHLQAGVWASSRKLEQHSLTLHFDSR